jgi:hypothetical protein
VSDREYYDYDPARGCGCMLLMLLVAALVTVGGIAFIVWRVVFSRD